MCHNGMKIGGMDKVKYLIVNERDAKQGVWLCST